MKIVEVVSQGVKVRIKEYEVADIKKMFDDPAMLELLTKGQNLYERQKSALVDFRFDLVTAIVGLTKMPMLTKTVKVDGKDVTMPAETEGEYLTRAKTEAVKNASSPFAVALKVTGSTPDDRLKSFNAAKQAIAYRCGDIDADGKPIARDEKTDALVGPGFAYLLDIRRAPRQPGKAKTPPKYAFEGADNIIANHAEAKWADRWTKGYTNKLGVKLDPIAFESFQQVAPKGATPEAVEAVRQSNRTNLAWAVAADKAQVLEKTGTGLYD